jgi:tetrapyrrole methylase family protein / MazG family protein
MKQFDRLIQIIKTLRSPKGCPWDRAQKISDYERYLLEEAYELIEALRGNKPEEVREEIGDLYLILSMITEMFAEKKKFDHQQALDGISNKLIYRHPHVFGKKKIKGKNAVLAYWIKNKAKKKNRKTVKDRLPQTAPALLLAEVFLKEKKHIQDIKKEKPMSRDALIENIFKELKSIKGSGKNEEAFDDLLIDISRLAYMDKIQAESLLRSRVLREAERIRY